MLSKLFAENEWLKKYRKQCLHTASAFPKDLLAWLKVRNTISNTTFIISTRLQNISDALPGTSSPKGPSNPFSRR